MPNTPTTPTAPTRATPAVRAAPAVRVAPLADWQRGRYGAGADDLAPAITTASGSYFINDKGGVRLSLRHPTSCVAVLARAGAEARLSSALEQHFSTPSPPAGRMRFGEDAEGKLEFAWFAPNQFYAFADNRAEGALAATLTAALDDTATIIDQSHGRVVFRIAGANATELLARGSSVDFHERAFPEASTAPTTIAHCGVLVVRPRLDTFEVSLFRGFADSFAEWLREHAAPFGYTID